MGALENEFQISQELIKHGKIIMRIRFHFVKFQAFEVCFHITYNYPVFFCVLVTQSKNDRVLQFLILFPFAF